MNHPFLTDALTLVMFYEYFFYEPRIVDLELGTYNVEQHRTRNVASEGREEWEPISKLLGASSSRNTTLVVVDLASVLGKKVCCLEKARNLDFFLSFFCGPEIKRNNLTIVRRPNECRLGTGCQIGVQVPPKIPFQSKPVNQNTYHHENGLKLFLNSSAFQRFFFRLTAHGSLPSVPLAQKGTSACH